MDVLQHGEEGRRLHVRDPDFILILGQFTVEHGVEHRAAYRQDVLSEQRDEIYIRLRTLSCDPGLTSDVTQLRKKHKFCVILKLIKKMLLSKSYTTLAEFSEMIKSNICRKTCEILSNHITFKYCLKNNETLQSLDVNEDK